jgi:hypothetical protein
VLAESPLANRIPLIVEPSWPSNSNESNLAENRNKLVDANLRNLRGLLEELEV